MEKKYRISPNIVFCFGYLLLNLQLTDGAVTVSYTGTPYLGQSFMMKCTITSFTGTATWAHDGTTHATCGSTFCSPPSKGNYTFSYSGSTLSVTIDPVLSSDQGKWQCTHTSGSDSYVLNPQTSQSSVGDQAGLTNGIIAVIVVVCVVVFILFLGGVAVALGYGKYITCGRRKVHVLEFKNDNEVTEIKNVVLTKSETKDIADVIPEQYDSTSCEWTHNGETLLKTKIERASTKHAGFYVCKIKGERLLKIQLMVLGTEETVYVEKGKDTFLGYDTPAGNTNAKWTHDGKLLTSIGMRINIHNAVPKDTGLYVCTLAESSESFKHQLIVIDDALIIANPKLKSYMTTLSQ